MSSFVSPDRIASSSTLEAAQQTALFCWIAMNVPHCPELEFAFAIPNGGERNKIVAAQLKAQGVRAGVPDIMLPVVAFVDGRWHPGLWIELKKRKGGKENDPAQLRWAAFLKEQGFMHVKCRGYEPARDAIKHYMGEHRPWRDTG